MCCGNSRRHGGRRVRRNGSDSDAYSVAYSDVVEGRNPFIMRNIRPSGFPIVLPTEPQTVATGAPCLPRSPNRSQETCLSTAVAPEAARSSEEMLVGERIPSQVVKQTEEGSPSSTVSFALVEFLIFFSLLVQLGRIKVVRMFGYPQYG
ncbi:hypothetical protein FG05_13229 [Fusarium graminearum]|nr:hypothetical protein FG05_13229 [Fusarium graminearum]